MTIDLNVIDNHEICLTQDHYFSQKVHSSVMMDTGSEKLCLQWNDFKENITFSFRELREDQEFSDVTLACEDGQQIEAHKVVLASSSPFFKELLKKTKHPHPLLYMRGIRSEDLMAIMDFLYFGEANVFQQNLDSFLALAEELRLKGLTGGAESEKEPVKETPKPKRFPLKQQIGQDVVTPMSNSSFASPSSSGSHDTTVALTKDKISVEIQDLDEQIMSMITKSDISAGKDQGKLATCNVCGKEGSFRNMPQHVEANHITGIVHSCDICGKTSRSRHALNTHIYTFHKLHDNNEQKRVTGPEVE